MYYLGSTSDQGFFACLMSQFISTLCTYPSTGEWINRFSCFDTRKQHRTIKIRKYLKNICKEWCVCVLSFFSCVRLFASLWTVTHQAPLSMGLSRQEYWSGLPCPSPEDLPCPGIKPTCLIPPAFDRGSFNHHLGNLKNVDIILFI